jgi:hypothetical protein
MEQICSSSVSASRVTLNLVRDQQHIPSAANPPCHNMHIAVGAKAQHTLNFSDVVE